MDKIFRKHFKKQGISDLNPETKLITLPIRNGYFIAELNLQTKKVLLPHNVHDDPNVELVEWCIDLDTEKDDFLKLISVTDDKYRFINDLFVEPNEFSIIKSTLEENNVVFIIGDPGIGKTYTIHLLKYLMNILRKVIK